MLLGHQGCEGGTWRERERMPPGLGPESPVGSRGRAPGRWVRGQTFTMADRRYCGLIGKVSHVIAYQTISVVFT